MDDEPDGEHALRSARPFAPLGPGRRAARSRPVADESYSEPRAVYDEARRRGMDLFTLTDHDTIAGALELARLPDTFVSEEVSCALPGGRELHLGVFDIDEAQHEAIAAAAAATRRRCSRTWPRSASPPASTTRSRRSPAGARPPTCTTRSPSLPLVEARNGMMSEAVNARAARAARRARLAMVGGSDAHTLASVARAFTVVPGARPREEFLAGLRRGLHAARRPLGQLRAPHRGRRAHRRGRLPHAAAPERPHEPRGAARLAALVASPAPAAAPAAA